MLACPITCNRRGDFNCQGPPRCLSCLGEFRRTVPRREWRVKRPGLCAPALLIISFLLLQPRLATPQTPRSQGAPAAPAPATTQSKPDNSEEPFIVESLATRARFENDGTGRLETTARVRIQTEAGVQAFGQLAFPYNSATERFTIPYVRAGRADAGPAETWRAAAPGDMHDNEVEAAPDAPLYDDAREKHVTVPPLHPGDTLEYRISEVIFQPLAPGQFWYQFDFEKNA